MKTKIKICGIKTLAEALFCLNEEVDYLGFSFVPISSRYIEPKTAKTIMANLPPGRIETVGVFRDETPQRVLETAKDLALDLIQLHGSENENYANLLPNLRIIKVINGDFLANKFPAEFLMIDREVQGEGKPVEFYKAAGLSR